MKTDNQALTGEISEMVKLVEVLASLNEHSNKHLAEPILRARDLMSRMKGDDMALTARLPVWLVFTIEHGETQEYLQHICAARQIAEREIKNTSGYYGRIQKTFVLTQ